MELERGDVMVTTASGLPLQTNQYTIIPSADTHAKYEVLDTSDSPRVKTYEGSVLVKEAKPVLN